MLSEASLITPVTLERPEIQDKRQRRVVLFLTCVFESEFHFSLKLNAVKFCRCWILNRKRQQSSGMRKCILNIEKKL